MKNQISLYLFIALLVSSGCSHTLSNSLKDANVPQAGFVECVGEFTDFEAEVFFCDDMIDANGEEFRINGVCPKATFRLTYPAIYSDRIIGIMYKYDGKEFAQPPALRKKGKAFSFQVPEDFFEGNYKLIDNVYIDNFRAAP